MGPKLNFRVVALDIFRKEGEPFDAYGLQEILQHASDEGYGPCHFDRDYLILIQQSIPEAPDGEDPLGALTEMLRHLNHPEED